MSHSPWGPSFGSLAPVPAAALAARGSAVAARTPTAPCRAWAARGSVPLSPAPAHVGGLGGSLARSQPPSGTVLPWGHPAEGEEGVQPNRRAGSCAAGSMLGSGRSDGALCLGLAAQHLGDESEEKLSEICNGEQG